MLSDAFRQAVESEDREALVATLAENVRFRSPVVFSAYEGRDLIGMILTEGAMNVFEDFRYVEQLEDGDVATLVFSARVGDRRLDGLDMLRFDGEGKVVELTVMVRPLSGVNALAEAMGRQFERLGLTPPQAPDG
jgi:SnoaL-like domain